MRAARLIWASTVRTHPENPREGAVVPPPPRPWVPRRPRFARRDRPDPRSSDSLPFLQNVEVVSRGVAILRLYRACNACKPAPTLIVTLPPVPELPCYQALARPPVYRHAEFSGNPAHVSERVGLGSPTGVSASGTVEEIEEHLRAGKPAMIYFRVVHTIMDPKCLTAVFGMGTGVATWVWSPERRMRRMKAER